MKRRIGIGLLIASLHSLAFGQIDNGAVEEFIEQFSTEHNIPEEEIRSILDGAEYQESIITRITKPAEGTMTWERYRKIFITEERIDAGVKFWIDNYEELEDISSNTGVPEDIITAIIGVESYFGRIKGNYKVLDALYTLSFAYPRRAKFFKSELEEFLILVREEKLEINEVKGSYAGAIGYCQFMPSSYRAYARSYDAGGTRDLLNSRHDAMASVANYLKVHRWKKGAQIAAMAKKSSSSQVLAKQPLKPRNQITLYENLGFEGEIRDREALVTLLQFEKSAEPEYWFCWYNFYVITRYNHSPLYALAVYQLAEEIKSRIGS